MTKNEFAQYKGQNKVLKRIQLDDQSLSAWQLPLLDHSDEDITSHFDILCDLIEENLKEPNNNVLIHCRMGISRSATFVIAFLMLKRKYTYDQAFTHVKNICPKISPNLGFTLALYRLDKKLHDSLERSPDSELPFR
jgi:protein-tyrosine phosphatase